MGRNIQGTLLASAARTATASSSDITVQNCKGVRIFITTTAHTATPSVVPTVEVKDPVSGSYTAILTGAAITDADGNITRILEVYPGSTAAANTVVSRPIGKTFRVTMTHGDTDSLTYSVGYQLLV